MPAHELPPVGDYWKMIRWVWGHVWDETYPENLDRETLALWRYAKKDEQAFMDKPILPFSAISQVPIGPQGGRLANILAVLFTIWIVQLSAWVGNNPKDAKLRITSEARR